MPSSNTGNMNLILPTIGQEPGPDWASDLNSNFSTLDQHDHTSGYGVPITPAGLSITADLSFIGNNATNLRSARFQPQGSPISDTLDLNCISVSGVDLYYRDGSGNVIRITQSGGVAGASGSIGGLVSPASATYIPGTETFVWQSDSNVAANMDSRTVTIRTDAVSSPGISLTAPVGLSSSYSATFPLSPPASTSIMQMSNTGNISVSNTISQPLVLSASLDVAANALIGTNLFVGDYIAIAGSGLTLESNAGILVLPAGLQPNGTGGARLTASGTATMDVVSNNGASSHPIVVSANPSTAGLQIVRGTVSSTGTAVSGEGFSVSVLGTGNYTITFTTAFLDVPAFTAIVSEFVNTPYIVTAQTIAAGSVTIQIYHPFSGAHVAQNFSFIAIGQRG